MISRFAETSMVKRLFDLSSALLLFLVLGPLLIILAFLVWFKLKSPPFFIQTRPGLHGKPFRLYKFRTMTDARDAQQQLLPNAERLPSFGRFLRNSSMDELPELWNVLKGDMSLVGPRPLLMQYLERYTPEQARRHEVKPGLTGWAQVNGRNAITWEEKFGLDVWYVENRSFLLDLKILAMTVWKVLQGEGISAPGDATMPEFQGTRNGEMRKRNA